MSALSFSPHPLAVDCQQPVLPPSALPTQTGTIKRDPEDFRVEELPAYLPSGDGDHLFLWIEKRDVAAFALVEELARSLGIDAGDIGVAGMKDARAITRQWVSVPASASARLADGAQPQLAERGIRILEQARHGNKLRTGHLRANRFDVLVRDLQLEPEALQAQAERWVTQTETFGVLNSFGSQRFGVQGATVSLGLGVLGVDGVRRAPRLSKGKLRLALSAVQSALFNAFIRERLQTESLYRVRTGDVAMVCASGGPFVVEDADEVNARVGRHEAVLSGPLYGPKMRAAQGDAQTHEAHLLTRFGLSPSTFVPFSKLAQGARRACVVWPEKVSASCAEPGCLRVQFTLPSGTYATELLGQWLQLSSPPRSG